MYAYIHPICRKPAYLMADKPVPGKQFLAAQLYGLNHQHLPPGSGNTCQSCGDSMFGHAGSVDNVVNYIQWKAEQAELVLSE